MRESNFLFLKRKLIFITLFIYNIKLLKYFLLFYYFITIIINIKKKKYFSWEERFLPFSPASGHPCPA